MLRSFPLILKGAGALIWLGLSATTLLQSTWAPRLAVWAVASLAFAIAFWRSVSRERPTPIEMFVQGLGITTMVGLLCNGFEGLLLVLMAAQLGYWPGIRRPLLWIGATAVALFVAISVHWALRPALLLAPPYLGFSLLMFVATRSLTEARFEERLRIMQGLHDSLGHRLTAMSINLEIAAHSSPGAEATDAVRTAQMLARAALLEIRSLAQETREEQHIDLERELRQLTEDLPRPRLHLTCSSPLTGLNPEVARILLQSVQEVTTNAIRHGAASNLWIDIARNDGSIELRARDDGHGTATIHVGFGLAGIQRRVEARGGKVSLGSTVGQGFEVRLEVPCEAVAPS